MTHSLRIQDALRANTLTQRMGESVSELDLIHHKAARATARILLIKAVVGYHLDRLE